MKINASAAEQFVRDPAPECAAVLVYGPDGGLVRERARKIAATVVDDLSDPFRVTELTAGSVREDPARLADEASSLSLIGGRRVVRLREAGDATATVLEGILETVSPADVLVVVEAGDLGPRSKLRKLFEGAAGAAALPCYADDARSLGTVIRETLGQAGLDATPDAMAYLADHLGSDRMLTRMELEKLTTYAFGKGEVTLEDAEAVVGDGAASTLDDIVFATADGDMAGLDRFYQRAIDEGVNTIAIVRAVQRHFQRLHRAAGDVSAGLAPDQAIKKLRPPVFFKRAGQFRAELQTWDFGRLGDVLDALTDAEVACKSTGVPAVASCRRTLLAIAGRAAQRRGNRR
jgi:DNA polymerase-3 subunit delta